MSLYLCIIEHDVDVYGVDVGFYSDFGTFRNAVSKLLEDGMAGSKYPTLMLHSDCDGLWTVADCLELERELCEIEKAFSAMPAELFKSEWQRNIAKLLGLQPKNLNESFIDVDGELLIERLINLCQMAQKLNSPIIFQ